MPSQQEGDARPDAGQATYTYTETQTHLHVNVILFCERGSCWVEAVSRWLPELRAISQAAGRPSVSLVQPFTPRNIKPVNGEMFSSFWRFGERDGPHRCPRWTPTPPKVAMGAINMWSSYNRDSQSAIVHPPHCMTALIYLILFHFQGGQGSWDILVFFIRTVPLETERPARHALSQNRWQQVWISNLLRLSLGSH